MRVMQTSRMLAVYFWAMVVYLIFPILIVLPVSFSDNELLRFPPTAFSLRWYQSYFNDPVWVDATLISFRVAVVSMVISTTAGTGR